MNRREFLTSSAAAMAVLPLNRGPQAAAQVRSNGVDWTAVRRLFPLEEGLVHMSGFYLASHAAPVQAAIDAHRRGLDGEPLQYVSANNLKNEAGITAAAAQYMGVSSSEIALTDSTTMGLGLLLTGLKLRPGDEVVTSTHDHFSTEMSLQMCADRTGATIKRIPLYRSIGSVSAAELVSAVRDGVTPRTRFVVLTWVHSGTGLKLPIRSIAEAIEEDNRRRPENERVRLLVDGVHGFGVEPTPVSELGCDAFVAGTHKWIFGPRGTGVAWARTDTWAQVWPSIPSWYGPHWQSWIGWREKESMPVGMLMTPGGFHSFENRWALAEAFKLHLSWGRQAIADRIHALTSATKEGLRRMRHVTLHTPTDRALSSGIICFDVAGMRPQQVVAKLRERGVVASTTPYRTIHARLSPSLLTLETDVERTLESVRNLV